MKNKKYEVVKRTVESKHYFRFGLKKKLQPETIFILKRFVFKCQGNSMEQGLCSLQHMQISISPNKSISH